MPQGRTVQQQLSRPASCVRCTHAGRLSEGAACHLLQVCKPTEPEHWCHAFENVAWALHQPLPTLGPRCPCCASAAGLQHTLQHCRSLSQSAVLLPCIAQDLLQVYLLALSTWGFAPTTMRTACVLSASARSEARPSISASAAQGPVRRRCCGWESLALAAASSPAWEGAHPTFPASSAGILPRLCCSQAARRDRQGRGSGALRATAALVVEVCCRTGGAAAQRRTGG